MLLAEIMVSLSLCSSNIDENLLQFSKDQVTIHSSDTACVLESLELLQYILTLFFHQIA